MSELSDQITNELIDLELEIAAERWNRDEERKLLITRKNLLLRKVKKGDMLRSIYNLIESGVIIYNPTER